MKKLIIIIATVAVIFGGLLFIGRANGQQAAKPGLTFASVKQDTLGGAKLYDVRTPAEYAAGHFEGAINWPVEDIQAGKMSDVPKDSKMYVYCRSGNRSNQAAAALKAAGYTGVIDLQGLPDVQAIGGELVTQ